MAATDLIFDFADFDENRVLADLDEIRRLIPHRFEMEQLTAIVHEDIPRQACAGYKDLTDRDFWVRGHMPGMPLMPGVLICEMVAQLCSYFAIKHDLLGTSMVGLGGLEQVRFRGPVRPGDRLLAMAQVIKHRRGALIVCRFQAFVRRQIVCEGQIKGVPMPIERLTRAT